MSKGKQVAGGQQGQAAAEAYAKYLAQDFDSRQKALAQYAEYKQEYKDLQRVLKDLPNEIEHEAMIPVGPLAFFPGKLVHTNEILVLLGDNWFVERSASQAVEIAKRREEFVNEKIAQIKREVKELSKRREVLPSALPSMGEELEQAMYNEDGERIIDIKEELTEEHLGDDSHLNIVGDADLTKQAAALKAVRERAIADGDNKDHRRALGKEEQDLLAMADQFDSEDEDEEEEEEDSEESASEKEEEDEEGDAFSDEDRANAARDDDDDDFNDLQVRETRYSDREDDDDEEGFKMSVVERYSRPPAGNEDASSEPRKGILKEKSPMSYFKKQRADAGSRKSVSFDKDIQVHVPHSQELLDKNDEDSEVSKVANLLSAINMSNQHQISKQPKIVVLDDEYEENKTRAGSKESYSFKPSTAMSGVRSKKAMGSIPPTTKKETKREAVPQQPMKQAIVEKDVAGVVTQDIVDEELHSREIAQAYNRMRFARMSAGKLDGAAEVAERVLKDLPGVKLVDSKAPKKEDDGYERIELPGDPSPFVSTSLNPQPPEVVHQESRPSTQPPEQQKPKMSRFKAQRLGLDRG
ncbi:hypothetical protein GGI12_005585 [Dipsacomyces acuminosporus]|nr:hypothetical protein GGI12_005585 [Dipsacomyces acuminosporus]